MSDTVITPVFRVSFPNVFEKKSFQNGEPKYNLTMIFPETFDNEADELLFSEMKRLGREAIKSRWPTEAEFNKVKNKLKNPFRIGNDEKPEIDGYQDAIFVVASTFRQPSLVDADLNEIIDPEEFYAGCYARAKVNAYAFDKAGNKGVAFGLQSIMKVKDGDPFGAGRSNAQEDFKDFVSPKASQTQDGYDDMMG